MGLSPRRLRRRAAGRERHSATSRRGGASTFRTPVTDAHWIRLPPRPEQPARQPRRRRVRDGDRRVRPTSARRSSPVRSASSRARPAPARRPSSSALIEAIERTEGAGASFQLLAPTGKAAERLRERTGRRGRDGDRALLPRQARLAQRQHDVQARRRAAGGRDHDLHHRRVLDAQPRAHGGALPRHQLELRATPGPRRRSEPAAADRTRTRLRRHHRLAARPRRRR